MEHQLLAVPTYFISRGTQTMSASLSTRTLSFVGLLACTLLAYAAETPLVVHEWGTFTSIADNDGSVIEWEPYWWQRRDLPNFVYGSKTNACGTVRMETPVIYFYSAKALTCTVRVGFPRGQITEFFPMPDQWVYPLGAIQWSNVELLQGAGTGLPLDKSGSHYYHARETDATTLRMWQRNREEQEKFLFYRGVGTFALPLSGRLAENNQIVVDVGDSGVGEVVLFGNRKGKVGCTFERLRSKETAFDRALPECSVEQLEQNLQALLVRQGLYQREAAAMVKTWEDSWFEEGLRIFYILPRKHTDTILPLAITPQPRELVRVLMGRLELVTPETKEDTVRFLTRLSKLPRQPNPNHLVEDRPFGRFLEPIIRRVLQSDSALRGSGELQKALKNMGLLPRSPQAR